jgi:L-ribulose-5-phosphate 3-epimerase
MLKLGIVADEINRDFHAAVKLGLQADIRRYEIRFLKTGRAPLCEAAEIREIERICDGEGLAITALSPGLFKWTDTPEKFQHEMKEVFPRAVELAQRWNLSALIVFGFQKWGATEENADMVPGDNPPLWVIDALTEAAAHAASVKLQLFIEPEPVCYADSGAAAAQLIQAVNSPALGINYDPCNDAWMLRRDPIKDFDVVAPFIRNAHIKDQLDAPVGSGMPKWVMPGEGMLDWQAHFAALRGIGYAGPLSLEPHFPLTVESLKRYKDIILQMWESL